MGISLFIYICFICFLFVAKRFGQFNTVSMANGFVCCVCVYKQSCMLCLSASELSIVKERKRNQNEENLPNSQI